MRWIDRLARRTALADGVTRRQAIGGVAAGAMLAGPAGGLLSHTARGAGCVRVDAACATEAEAAFTAAVARCDGGGTRRGLWSELRCRVQAQAQLSAARTTCRVPDHALCAAGERCDAATGGCVAPPPDPPPGPAPQIGLGPCAGDWPTAASLRAARAAVAAGASVVDLSPGGCLRLERSSAGDGAIERLTLAGTIVAEYVTTPGGMTGRRDADRDGFFELELAVTGVPATVVELTTRDPATRAITRRERRLIGEETVDITIEEHGRLAHQYTVGPEAVAHGAGLAIPIGEYCGAERDARYGDMLFDGIAKATGCLEQYGRGDLALEVMHAATHVEILCADLPGSVGLAPDAFAGAPTGRVRVILDPEAMDARTPQGQAEIVMHEVMHYTSLGLHDAAQSGNIDGTYAHFNDRVYACARLCMIGEIANQCQCATCLDTTMCDERCKALPECPIDMGAICPCPGRRKWYPSMEKCTAECPSGLLCFGFGTCKPLDRRC